ALLVPRRFATPQAIAEAGLAGLTQLAQLGRVQVHRRTLLRILGWAQNAPVPDGSAPLYRELVCSLNDDRITKENQIVSSERELFTHRFQTPYSRLLAMRGINVVLAGNSPPDAGPIVH